MFRLLFILVILTPLFSDCVQIFINDSNSVVNETVINSGDTLNLKCVGDVPLDWEAPLLNSAFGNEPPSPFSFKSKKQGNQYETVLTLSNADYLYTGYYSCHPKGQPNAIEKESIYVYVKDQNHLLVVNDSVVMITVKEFDTLVIPCRPSSPDVNVTLTVGGETVTDVEFDPQIGFIKKNAQIFDTGSFTCEAVKDNVPEYFYVQVIIIPHTEKVEMPYINSTLVNHLLVGDTAILDCSINVDPGIIITMDWVLPNQELFRNNHSQVVPVPHDEVNEPYKHYIEHKKLIINNVTFADAGTYVCNVTDHSQHGNQNSIDLKVYHDNSTYLNLSTSQDYYRAYGKSQAYTWLVHIASHPQVKPENIVWYHKFANYEKKIEDDNHEYLITRRPADGITKLTIKNLTVHDSGTYRVNVNNSRRNKSLTMELIVEDTPEVQLKTEDYYLENRWHTVSCIITGYNVNISWSHQSCSNYEENHSVNYTGCEDKEFHPYPVDSYDVIEIGEVHKNSTLRVFANSSQILMCLSCSSAGLGCREETSKFLVSDVDDGFDLYGPSTPVTGDTVVLSCGVSYHKFKDGLIWEHKYKNNSIDENFPGTNAFINTYKTKFSLHSNLTLRNVSDLTSGIYICRQNKTNGLVKNLTLNILPFKEPKFVNVTFPDGEETILVDQSLRWDCRASGTPAPEIIWLKNGNRIHEHSHHKPQSKNANKPHILFSKNNTIIEITSVAKDDAGMYSCVAKNRIKEIRKDFLLKVVETADSSLLFLYIFLALVGVCSIIIIVLVCRVKKEKELRKQLTADGLINFEDGAVESLNPDLDVAEQADLLPYNKKFEFPRSKLKLGKQLGSGAFGVVLKAEAEGITEPGVKTIVAVKMVKQNVDVTHIKALASELKIMIHLGGHINVVNLLGACTSNLNKRELLVIVEYCPFGNLHKFLQQHRDTFINQVNQRTGRFDPTIITSVPKAKYVNVPEYNSTSQSNSNGTVRLGSISSDNRQINSAGSDVTSPAVGEDGYLMCRPPEELILNKLHEDKANQPISTQDLLCWSFQIARGMDYLASRKVLHGDLAARNILLAENNIVKICDFGLSKNMYSYKNDHYFKKGKRLLPVKWMALEAIRDRNFSIQSDVWAYGIVLWELFSLARTPYPGLEDVEILYRKLEQGYRMELPEYATQELYKVMMDCWHARPSMRPSFTDLAEKLGEMLEDSVRKHYVDLNDPFLAENAEYLSQRDYLSMLSSPTYANLDKETGESLSNATSGYVSMRQRQRSDAQEETELRPMLSSQSGRNGSLSDVDTAPNSPAASPSPTGNYVTVTEAAASHGFSNPTYHNLGRPPINPYVNNPYVS